MIAQLAADLTVDEENSIMVVVCLVLIGIFIVIALVDLIRGGDGK